MRRPRAVGTSMAALAMAAAWALRAGGEPVPSRTEHPLMPGVRDPCVWQSDWPRALHDALATGFSPLPCALQAAPVATWEIPGVGAINWVRPLPAPQAAGEWLVDDGRWRRIDAAGRVAWTCASPGAVLAVGDLRGDGGLHAVAAAGARLTLIDLRDGRTAWQTAYEPAYVALQGQVADLFPDEPGMELALFPHYAEWGAVLNLSAADGPRVLWQRPVVENGEFNERYDHHGGTIELDFSQPKRPAIWNLRRHRLRGFDARTGEALGSLAYAIGGEQRRNYGPLFLGRDASGQLYGCVFGERVQTHVHAIRLRRDGPNELAWQHYYGEVYKEAPGTSVQAHGVADVDGDGNDELVYSVRDPACGLRSFVRARDVVDGTIDWELADQWGLLLFAGIGAEPTSGLLAVAAPDGATPDRGSLSAYRFRSGGPPAAAGSLPAAGLWGPRQAPGSAGVERLLLRSEATGRAPTFGEYDFADGQLRRAVEANAPALLRGVVLAAAPPAEDAAAPRWVLRQGANLLAIDAAGRPVWQTPLEGGDARLSAADLDRDGRSEIVASMSDRRLRVFACEPEGRVAQRFEAEHVADWHSQHPVVADLEGNGRLALLTCGSAADGRLAVRAQRLDQTLLWQTPLPVSAEEVRGALLNPGRFLGPEAFGVAVSVTDDRLIREGTYMLDGATGRIVWFKGMYRDGPVVMPYRPNGIPTAYDFDGDGVEEVGMDLLSYMAFLRGTDGEFVFVRHTSNIRSEGAVAAGKLYNTYCPLFQTPHDARPHWFVTAGFGPFGLVKPDPTQRVWSEDLDYDVPPHIALVDVDGDGQLEAGYAPLNDKRFVCRNAWTGQVEWTLELPYPPNAGAICADFDGDGRGEFFLRQFCIGVDDRGQGRIEWTAPLPLAGPLVADVDGDGQGELAGVHAGRIVVLDAAEGETAR